MAKVKKSVAVTKEIKALLAAKEAALKAGEKKEAKKIRRQLRAKGYFISKVKAAKTA